MKGCDLASVASIATVFAETISDVALSSRCSSVMFCVGMFRVYGSGLRVQGSGIRMYGSAFKIGAPA